MSPLSYGVMPFSINSEKHQSKIDIETPKLIKPGNALPIKVHTSEKQKVIVFAIDAVSTSSPLHLPRPCKILL